MRLFIELCVADPVRYQLIMERPIPGFAGAGLARSPSRGTRAGVEAAGVHGEAALDMLRALFTGLISLQIANDPGGDRWIRLQVEAF